MGDERPGGARFERFGVWTDVPRPDPLRTTIRSALLNALAYTDGHQGQAARLLEMKRTTFLNHLDVYHIPRARRGAAQPRRMREKAS